MDISTGRLKSDIHTWIYIHGKPVNSNLGPISNPTDPDWRSSYCPCTTPI